jgi:hypothetical protein
VGQIRAIEENGEEFLVALGRAAGAQERDDPEIRWVFGDIPIDYHNCVVHADLSPEEADAVILESLERFRAHGATGSWHVGPSMRPADIGERLLAHGFEYGGDDIGMAVDLRALPEEVSIPEDLAIEQVCDEKNEISLEIQSQNAGAVTVFAWTGETAVAEQTVALESGEAQDVRLQIGDAEREASLENGRVLVGFQTEDGGADSVAVRIR